MIVIPIVAAVAGITALIARKRKPSAYQVDEATAAQRRVIYAAALDSKNPVALRKLSQGFREQGCIVEADLLDKRVAILELPEETTLARREVFRRLMKCTNPSQVRHGAMVFEEQGCTGAAADLNRYAQGLEDAGTQVVEGTSDAVANQ